MERNTVRNQLMPLTTALLLKKSVAYSFIFDCAGSCRCTDFSLVAESRGLLSGCGAWASHFIDFSCCRRSTGSRAHGLQELRQLDSVVAAPGLQSTGSVVVMHRPSCSVACGVLSGQGTDRVSCIGRHILRFFTPEPPGKPPPHILSAGSVS